MSDSAPPPTQQASAWLADFGAALERADLEAAQAMLDFGEDGSGLLMKYLRRGSGYYSRHYSQFLALQLKARMEGIPTPVYGLGVVHHLA